MYSNLTGHQINHRGKNRYGKGFSQNPFKWNKKSNFPGMSKSMKAMKVERILDRAQLHKTSKNSFWRDCI